MGIGDYRNGEHDLFFPNIEDREDSDLDAASGVDRMGSGAGQDVRSLPEMSESQEQKLSDEQIKYMVERFLGWRLPENFNPDAGISFKREFNEHAAHPMMWEPTGTNLFDYTQAEAMVRYLVDGMPTDRRESAQPSPRHAEEFRERRNEYLYIRCSCGYEVGPFLYADYAQDAMTHHVWSAAAQPEAGEPRPKPIVFEDTDDEIRAAHSARSQAAFNKAAPSIEPLTAEQWGDDFLMMERSGGLTQQQLIAKYHLDCRLGQSILASMFRAFAHQVRQEAERPHEFNQCCSDAIVLRAEIARLTAELDEANQRILGHKHDFALASCVLDKLKSQNERAEAALRETREILEAIVHALHAEVGQKGNYWKARKLLDKLGKYHGNVQGLQVLIDLGELALKSSTPAEGQA